MKLKIKKGEVEAEIGAEKLIEKGMDQHDKNWKDKFSTKHNAKKEMLELKHKQKLEKEEQSQKKKSIFERIEEEKRKTRQLELEEQRRQEEERKKGIKVKIIFSIILGIVGGTMSVVGGILGSASGDPNSGWYMMSVFGMFPLMSIAFIWIASADNNKKKKRRK